MPACSLPTSFSSHWAVASGLELLNCSRQQAGCLVLELTLDHCRQLWMQTGPDCRIEQQSRCLTAAEPDCSQGGAGAGNKGTVGHLDVLAVPLLEGLQDLQALALGVHLDVDVAS